MGTFLGPPFEGTDSGIEETKRCSRNSKYTLDDFDAGRCRCWLYRPLVPPCRYLTSGRTYGAGGLAAKDRGAADCDQRPSLCPQPPKPVSCHIMDVARGSEEGDIAVATWAAGLPSVVAVGL